MVWLMLFSHSGTQDRYILLPHVMRSFRVIPHSKTDETSNYLMFGRGCRLPDQLMPGTHLTQRMTRTDFALDLKERLDSAYDLIRSQQRLPCRSTDEQEPSRRTGPGGKETEEERC